MHWLYVWFLGLAVSMDGFAAGMAYGLKEIRIPFFSLLIAALVTAVCTTAAMLTASYLGSAINPAMAVIAGAFLLIAIGIYNIFQEYIKKSIAARPCDNYSLHLSIGRIVIRIMVEPENADMDDSKMISPWEALFLGLALGIDNMVATFAACLSGMLPLYTPIIMGMIQMLVITLGFRASKYLVSDRIKKQMPYLPGVVLITLGLLRLF